MPNFHFTLLKNNSQTGKKDYGGCGWFLVLIIAAFLTLIGIVVPVMALLFGILFFFSIYKIYKWFWIETPAEIATKKLEKEQQIFKREQKKLERQKAEEENAELTKKAEFEKKIIAEMKYESYLNLRKEIESMPIYKKWREAVINKFGRQCGMCGSTNNTEVHHRQSLHSIIKLFRIKNIQEAFDCTVLWDVDNGGVLCQECHKKTKSHIDNQ